VTASSTFWISSAEAADRLGVKRQSLYAYVSRGQLVSHRRPGLPGTWFDLADIEEFARRNPPRNAPSKRTFAFKGVSSHVSSIEDGELFYRGEPAVELGRTHTFDAVARWLLTGDFAHRPCGLSTEVCEDIRAATSRTGDDLLLRLQVAVAVGGSHDRLRSDLSPSGLARSSARMTAAMLVGLGAPSSDTEAHTARACARVLAGPGRPDPAEGVVALVDRALVLLLDHGLATSTVAARVAASTRADPYAVVLSGLAALSGPLHGAASSHVHTLIGRVLDGADLEWAIAQYLEHSAGVFVAFGSPQYPEGDPRAADLLDGLRAVPEAADALEALDAVLGVLGERAKPNIDAALAVLCHAGRLRSDAGTALFALARAAGWVAHAAEEYREHPLRWRGH